MGGVSKSPFSKTGMTHSPTKYLLSASVTVSVNTLHPTSSVLVAPPFYKERD